MRELPDVPSLASLQVVVMPNGDVIHCGNIIGHIWRAASSPRIQKRKPRLEIEARYVTLIDLSSSEQK